MKLRTLVIGAVLWLTVFLVSVASGQTSWPQVYCVPPRNLETAKQLVARNQPAIKSAYVKLIENAEAALLSKPGSVMDKTKVAASGNKHDFFSYGPYWWPDPSKPDGMPYIRHDGYTNPRSKIGTDSIAFTQLLNNTEALAYAYYFTGRDAYAAKAAELVRVWFLNRETAMNPSGNYAQAIPGVANGRFEGVIELRGLTRIVDAAALIESSAAWTKNDRSAFRRWLESYYDWLTHNKLPIDATSTQNNHESWRDVQIIHLSVVLGNPDYARTFLQQEFPRLLEEQIGAKGEQPHELVRTNSLGYSLFNLEALFRLAVLGESVGVDCWKYTTKDHGSLDSALDYLAPYVDPGDSWPDDEVVPTPRRRLLPFLVQGYDQRQTAKLKSLLDKFYGDGPDFWRLQWPYERQAKISQK
jgi:hypothetical protein